MTVYFLQAGEDGPVKVGCSEKNAAWARFDAIQSCNHEPLIMRAILEGDRKIEQAIHAFFKPYRMHGEWFRAEGDFKQLLEYLPEPPERKISRLTHSIVVEDDKIVIRPINSVHKKLKQT